jgi:hypoxanthine phosphoribosyltransferase
VKDRIEVLFHSDVIKHRIKELAKQITSNMETDEIVLVGLLKGSMMFIADLARELNVDTKIDFMIASSYDKDTSSKNVKIKKDLEEDIKGKEVLIVEDIVDSGYTINKILDILKTREPKSLKVCVLLDKVERREKSLEIDYVGFKIADEFVIGYGMDYDQRYRNLPYIGIIRNAEKK